MKPRNSRTSPAATASPTALTESRPHRAPAGASATAHSKAAAKASQHAGAVLEIDLDAVAENFKKLAERVGPNVRVAAVVKADAYGLGVEKVAPAPAPRPSSSRRSMKASRCAKSCRERRSRCSTVS